MHQLTSGRGGFTLIEMVISILILATLAASLAPLLAGSFQGYEINQSNLETLGRLRYATERIAREVREVRHNGTNYQIATMGPATLSFTKNDAANTVVTINSAPPLATLTYSTPPLTPAQVPVLTDRVVSLQFDYFDINNSNVGVTNINVAAIDVVLTLTDPHSGTVQQRTRIALRNR